MQRILSTTLAPALIAAAASAQSLTVTPIVQEGDSVPGIGLVTRIDNVDVNNAGDWLVEIDTDNTDTGVDAAVLWNGAVLYQEGTSTGIAAPAGATTNWVDSMDVNNNGDVMCVVDVDVPGSTSGRDLLIWNGMTMIEGEVTPITASGVPSGSVFRFVSEVWQNDNDEFLILASYQDPGTSANIDFMMYATHDGAGNFTSQTILAKDGDFMPGHTVPVTTFSSTKTYQSMNNSGQILWMSDDDNANGTADDSYYWITDNGVTSELLHEGDPWFDDPTRTYAHLSICENDINDQGDWIMGVNLDSSDTSNNSLIIKNGNQTLYREGDPVPGIPGGFLITSFSNGPIQISTSGEVMWYADWDDPDTAVDTALFIDDTPILQEGVSVVAGQTILGFSTSSDGKAMSDDGSKILVELDLADGTNGAYLVERELFHSFCAGDGSGSPCPCANFGGTGEGCANSTGAGAVLVAAGSASVALDNLSFTGEQFPVNQPGLLFSADNAINGGNGNPFGDGLRCAGGNLKRLGVVTADAAGRMDWGGGFAAAGGWISGDTKRFQGWYRDPSFACSGAGFNFTQGIEVTFVP